jgi:transmembrane sensor
MEMRQSASEIEEQAARWVMRLDREGRSPAVEADLKVWLSRDTRRAGALLLAEAAWSTLDRARLFDRESAPPRPGLWRAAPRRAFVAGLAAAAAAVVVGVVLVNQPDRYVTGVGEVRRFPLADGSTASINTASRMEVEFGDRLRRVRLDRGEAWFQVVSNPDRPFRVDVGRIRIQAVGTAFSVRRVDDGVEVRVTEGVVKVWVDGSSGRTIELPAGSTSTVSDRAGASAPVSEPSAIDRELAWRSGRIDLAGETLQEAVTEFNRYNARALVLEDPTLADERLYGVFRLDDPDGFAASVAVSLRASVSSDDASIRIGRQAG